MLNVVKHLGCIHVDVHEILRFAQDDKWLIIDMENKKKNIWGIIIQTLITILTAIGTSLGVTSCL